MAGAVGIPIAGLVYNEAGLAVFIIFYLSFILDSKVLPSIDKKYFIDGWFYFAMKRL